MAALATQIMTENGFTPTYVDVAATDTAEIGNGHNTWLVYKNTSATPLAAVVNVPGNTFFGVAEPDNAITVPATTGEKWVPLRKEYDDGTGRAVLTHTSPITGQKIAVVRIA